MPNPTQPGPVPGVSVSAADLAGDADTTERLSADDMATLREGQFLAAALAAQRQVHAASVRRPGVCRYCDAACGPFAVYCDEDCRADDEQRTAVLRRQGRRA